MSDVSRHGEFGFTTLAAGQLVFLIEPDDLNGGSVLRRK
jgi:hypothetical protein